MRQWRGFVTINLCRRYIVLLTRLVKIQRENFYSVSCDNGTGTGGAAKEAGRH